MFLKEIPKIIIDLSKNFHMLKGLICSYIFAQNEFTKLMAFNTVSLYLNQHWIIDLRDFLIFKINNILLF